MKKKKKLYVTDLPPINDFPKSKIKTIEVSNEYCQRHLVHCDPRESFGMTQCLSCIEFKARCFDMSNKKIIDIDTKNDPFSKTFPENAGICLVDNDILSYNKNTTHVLAGTVRSENEIFLTTATSCVNKYIVDKTIKSKDYRYSKAPCDNIKACQPHGVLLHPNSHKPLINVEDIDFDLNKNGLKCHCNSDYTSKIIKPYNYPACVLRKPIKECSVKVKKCLRINYQNEVINKNDDDDDDEEKEEDYRCLCNPTLSVNVRDLVENDFNNKIINGDLTTFAYTKNYIYNLTEFFIRVLEGNDHCIPLPGVESKNAAFAYSAITEMGGLSTNSSYGDNKLGGHLINSVCLRKDGIDEIGRYRKNRMYGGGVVSSSGSGSVSAFLSEGGPEYNGNDVLMEGKLGENGETFTVVPNISIKVIPSSKFSFPGLGETSMEHSVSLLASSGRVYPNGVHMRDGTKQRETRFDEENTLVKMYEEHDLFMQKMNDPGVVTGAYVIPSEHDRYHTNYGEKKHFAYDDFLSKEESCPPICENYLLTPNDNARKSASFYPLVKLFRNLLGGGRTPPRLLKYFPTIYESLKTDENLGQLFRLKDDKIMNNLDTLGGLLIVPTIIAGKGFQNSWTQGNWVAEELTVNSPKKTNFYSQFILAGGLYNDSLIMRLNIPAPRIPFDTNIVSNFNSHTTCFGLQQFDLENLNAVRYNFKNENGNRPDFVKHQLFSAENFLVNNSIINLPPSTPHTFTELVDFSQRNFINSASVMKNEYRNQYFVNKNVRTNTISDYTAKRYKWESVKNHLCPKEYSEKNKRFYGNSMIRPTPPLVEAYTQMNNQMNSNFTKTKKSALLHFNQHCKNILPTLMGQYKFLSNGDAWIGANLNQWLPIFISNDSSLFPKINSQSPEYRHSFKAYDASSHFVKNPIDVEFRQRASNTCGCTHEIICNNEKKKEKKNSKTISLITKDRAGFLSRSTKMVPFIYQKRVPITDIRLWSAYNSVILNGNLPSKNMAELFKPNENLKKLLPFSPNSFAVAAYNSKRMNYLYGRQISSVNFTPETISRNVNSDGSPIIKNDSHEQFQLLYPQIYKNDNLTRFYESIITVMPSTISSNMLNSTEDGAKDIVAQMATPFIIKLPSFDNNNNPIRFVHNYPLTTRSFSGLECGQVIAEGQHSLGGFACPYKPWQEHNKHFRTCPNNAFILHSDNVGGEMIDNEFFEYDNENDEHEQEHLVIDLIRHYGAGCLFNIDKTDKNETSSYPLCGRFSYYAYPPTRQMTDQVKQPLAALGLSEFNINNNNNSEISFFTQKALSAKRSFSKNTQQNYSIKNIKVEYEETNINPIFI